MATTDFDLLVVGDANPDVIVSGTPSTLAFGQREQLVETGELVLGGSAAITACGAARLGLRTAFAGRVGADAAGEFVLYTLAGHGVDVSACVVDAARPTALTVVLVRGADRAILTSPGCLSDQWAVPPSLVARAAHVHVSSFFLQPGLDVAGLFRTARELGVGTSLDTNDDPSGEWKGLDGIIGLTDVLLPNDAEALAIAELTGQDVTAAARALAAKGTLPVVKRGAAGALAWPPEGPVHAPAVPNPSFVDAVGAGDSFNAGFLAARLNGLHLEACLRLAVRAGTLSTRAAGGTAAQPTWEEATS
ncbi:carbohydrate kinase family protein [Nonomuraea sp. bgisy101]|uniref:carbohydrate kinase family protein n=1 Tax=Nonomuraea sp. bgisy101 TaxID=3413784 RepID=UPI003D72969E